MRYVRAVVILGSYPDYSESQNNVNVYAIDDSGVETLCGNTGDYFSKTYTEINCKIDAIKIKLE